MKNIILNKILFLAAFVLFTLPISLHALSIDIFKVTTPDFKTQSDIQTWLAGGQFTLLESFESIDKNWHYSLTSDDLGTFHSVGAQAGIGSSSYKGIVGDADEFPYKFRVTDDKRFGRFNTTPDGSKFLDSADITMITLDIKEDANISKMFFFMTDPGDVGAKTSVKSINKLSEDFDIDNISSGQGNKSLWFVGIDAGDDYISNITWSTGDHTNDGFGLDDFTQVAPVPEPGTLLLLGAGITGLALYRRRSMNK